MNKQTFIVVGVLLAVAASLLVVIGRSNTASHAFFNAASSASQPISNNAPLVESFDAGRRDVLIAATRAMRAPAINEGTWINSEPLTIESQRGHVVVVDFWTFGCYNCRNTLPTVKRWDAKYREQGLTIIGVHTPESDHERNESNVRRAVRDQKILYPVVTDGDGATWRAYGIEAWPTTVILDKQGRVRYTHIGEGMYDEMERVIQKLLAENS